MDFSIRLIMRQAFQIQQTDTRHTPSIWIDTSHYQGADRAAEGNSETYEWAKTIRHVLALVAIVAPSGLESRQ